MSVNSLSGSGQSIGSAIRAWLRAEGHMDTYDSCRIKLYWRKIAGLAVARRTHKLEVRHTTLYVYVHSAALRHGLQSSSPQLVERINKQLGRAFIQRIVLK